VQQILTQGRVVRPYLGVGPLTVTPAIKAQAGLAVDQGVVLTDVASGSPAERAGLQQGDVIVAMDGKPITDEAGLRAQIQSHKIGDRVQITVNRNGKQFNVQAQLTQAPAP
jgi:S1-C subfamily serine protease